VNLSKKFVVWATEEGINVTVDDILTAREAYDLTKEIQKELFHYKEITGRGIE
jgi:elongation factor P hydroxylase